MDVEVVDRNLEAAFDRAIRAIAAHDLDGAAQELEKAAAQARDPQARELARLLATRVRHAQLSQAAPQLTAPAMQPRPVAAPADAAAGEQDDAARVTLLVSTTLLGLALWGPAVPGALGLLSGDNGRAAIGLYMLSAGGAFAIPYLATRDGVRWGETNLTFWGATRGAYLGFLLASTIGGDGIGQRATWASAGLGGAAGALVGFQVARRNELSPGRARLIALGGDVGTLWGFGVGHLANLDQHDRAAPLQNPDAQARGMAAAGVVGLGLGVAAAAAWAPRRAYGWGDGEGLRTLAFVGAFAAGSVARVAGADDDHSRWIVGAAMAGSAAGLVTGDRLLRTRKLSAGAAIAVEVATVAAGLVGAGLALIATDTGRSDRPILAAAAAGSLAGFALTYPVLSKPR